jgi:hypothetical protein
MFTRSVACFSWNADGHTAYHNFLNLNFFKIILMVEESIHWERRRLAQCRIVFLSEAKPLECASLLAPSCAKLASRQQSGGKPPHSKAPAAQAQNQCGCHSSFMPAGRSQYQSG